MTTLLTTEQIHLISSILRSGDTTRQDLVDFLFHHRCDKNIFECSVVVDKTLAELEIDDTVSQLNDYTLFGWCIDGAHMSKRINVGILTYIIEMLNFNPSDRIEINTIYSYKRLLCRKNHDALKLVLKSPRFKINMTVLSSAMLENNDDVILVDMLNKLEKDEGIDLKNNRHSRYNIARNVVHYNCIHQLMIDRLTLTNDELYQASLNLYNFDKPQYITNASADVIINHTTWSYGIYKLFIMMDPNHMNECIDAIISATGVSVTDRVFNVRSKKQPIAIKCNIVEAIIAVAIGEKVQNILENTISEHYVIIDQTYVDTMTHLDVVVLPQTIKILNKHAKQPLIPTARNFRLLLESGENRPPGFNFDFTYKNAINCKLDCVREYMDIVDKSVFENYESVSNSAQFILFINMIQFTPAIHNQDLIDAIYPKIKDRRLRYYVDARL